MFVIPVFDNKVSLLNYCIIGSSCEIIVRFSSLEANNVLPTANNVVNYISAAKTLTTEATAGA